MRKILREVNDEINKLEKMLIKVEAFLKEAPRGYLKYQRKGGRIYYYHYNNSGDCKEYINKEKIELAKALAKKYYYKNLKRQIDEQIDALRKFSLTYKEGGVDEIFDNMCEERKALIKPIEMTIGEQLKEWYQEEYEINTNFSENLKYETEQGEMVRSKSEVIIANILFQNKDALSYKYERPLEVICNGYTRTIHPDFTIINKQTGKIYYWEHAGRMDDPNYAEEFVRKMNTYTANGYVIGVDVLLTFETYENSLDVRSVKRLIERIIRMN